MSSPAERFTHAGDVITVDVPPRNKGAQDIPEMEIAVPARLFAALTLMARAMHHGACATDEGIEAMKLELQRTLSVWPGLADIGGTEPLFDECMNVLAHPRAADGSARQATPLPAAPVAAPTVVFQPGSIMVEQPRRGPARIERLPDGSMVVTPA